MRRTPEPGWLTTDRVPDLTLGLFGPRSSVKAMLHASRTILKRSPRPGVRFLNGGHDDISEAADRYARLADRLDAAVFAGSMHYDLARAQGWLTVPASYVALRGAALHRTLLRASLLDPDLDLTPLSIDSLPRADVEEAYEEVGLPSDRLHCIPYTGPPSVTGFAAFHRDLLLRGVVGTALTTILSVENELRSEGLSVLRIDPTRATVREAIDTAMLLGYGTRMEEQQIAMIAVELVASDQTPPGPSNYWQQEAMLTLHRILLAEARAVGATVVRRSESLFMVTTTQGGLERLTSHKQYAPFAAAVNDQMGLPVAIGLGVGHTARHAEVTALTGLDRSHEQRGRVAVHVDESAAQLTMPPAERPPSTADVGTGGHQGAGQRAKEHLRRILASHAVDENSSWEVGVEDVAASLGVSDRTSRRVVKSLVEANLAWPLPPARSPSGGRPAQRFRLLPDRLGNQVTTSSL